jgi:hypothetical protein
MTKEFPLSAVVIMGLFSLSLDCINVTVLYSKWLVYGG